MRLIRAIAPLLVASLFIMTEDGHVLGQTQPKAKTAAPATVPEVPLRTGAPAQQPENAAPPPPAWSSQCTSDGRQGALDCTVEQRVYGGQNRQLLVTFVVRVPSSSRKPALIIQLPLGLFLPAGASVQFDDNKPERLEVQTCDQKGCFISMPMSNEMLQSMSKSKRMSITCQDLAKKDVAIPIELVGFTAAYQKIQ